MTKDLTPKDVRMDEIAVLFPPMPDESRLLIGCRRSDFSASRIARAVEDCDAQVVNLNVTAIDSDEAEVVISLRVNLRNTEAIVRSLTRYGYEVISAKSSEETDNEKMRMRAKELLRYLDI